jgi:3-hydroxyacyl-CoA dehydrogenase
MVNEGVRILDEGIALRASDFEIVWTALYGFPEHRGGSMFMAIGIDLRHIAKRLQAHGRMNGDRRRYWAVSRPLTRYAIEARRLTAWRVGATNEEVIT